MAATADNAFELPKLRVSFGFEVTCALFAEISQCSPAAQNDTRFLEGDDNVAGMARSFPTALPPSTLGCTRQRF